MYEKIMNSIEEALQALYDLKAFGLTENFIDMLRDNKHKLSQYGITMDDIHNVSNKMKSKVVKSHDFSLFDPRPFVSKDDYKTIANPTQELLNSITIIGGGIDVSVV